MALGTNLFRPIWRESVEHVAQLIVSAFAPLFAHPLTVSVRQTPMLTEVRVVCGGRLATLEIDPPAECVVWSPGRFEDWIAEQFDGLIAEIRSWEDPTQAFQREFTTLPLLEL